MDSTHPKCLVCGAGRDVSRPSFIVPSTNKTCNEEKLAGEAGLVSVADCDSLPALLKDHCCKDTTSAPTPATAPVPTTPAPSPSRDTGDSNASPLAGNPKEDVNRRPTPAPTSPRGSPGSEAHDAQDLQDRKDPNQVYGGGVVSSDGLSAGGKAGIAIASVLLGILGILFITIMLKKNNTPKSASTVGMVLDPDGSQMKLEQGEASETTEAPVEDVALDGVPAGEEEEHPAR
eukprot:CAMPEP_0119009402 /NCGR_PEP_ID=MMETSP1176-20130426/4341_1 /TAXON_ID=265551 /ORGANISM="Synedropsis recta cf, Strain CCMP1620" /LENGTH=231 /DNA_ID=CAMNT_0006961911 /DNA_START=111 /DNA_END=803 /DNA_ORIENTATION=+